MFITRSFVSSSIRRHLMDQGWELVSSDDPIQQPSVAISPGGVSADPLCSAIVARRGECGLIVVCNERFMLRDFRLAAELRKERRSPTSKHTQLFGESFPQEIWCGVGFADIEYQVSKARAHLDLVDLLLVVDKNGHVRLAHNSTSIDW